MSLMRLQVCLTAQVRSQTASLAVLGASLVFGACGETGLLDTGRDLSVTVEVEPGVANVGEDVTFTLDAAGSYIVYLSVDYGDGEGFLHNSAVRTATLHIERTHAYAAAGTYTVKATAGELNGDVASSEAVVDIRE